MLPPLPTPIPPSPGVQGCPAATTAGVQPVLQAVQVAVQLVEVLPQTQHVRLGQAARKLVQGGGGAWGGVRRHLVGYGWRQDV